jgi:hypothetical protein
MKSQILILVCSLLLVACSSGIKMEQQEGFALRTQPQTVFVVPFTTIMVPDEVTEGLFNRFVDELNQVQTEDILEYVILKQGVDTVGADWLDKRDYVTGEVFAYVEEIGSSMASIRAKSRISLFQAGQAEPTLRIDYPVEIFYEKNYMSLDDARRKLADKISGSMARKLTEALGGNSI